MTDAHHALDLTFHPLTAERWADFERLFGAHGACGGCWCMLWRLERSRFEAQKGEANRKAMRQLVESGGIPGLLGYAAGEPVAWCAVAPREHYPALRRSRILQPVDERPVWSVSCLFVQKAYRRRGVSVAMLRAAIGFVRSRGGTTLEGYPVAPRKGQIPAVFAWTGTVSAFEQAGFTECLRRSATRPVMRVEVGAHPGPQAPTLS